MGDQLVNMPPIQYDAFEDIPLTAKTLEAIRSYGKQCVEANVKGNKRQLSFSEQEEVIREAFEREVSNDVELESTTAALARDLSRRLATMGYALVRTT